MKVRPRAGLSPGETGPIPVRTRLSPVATGLRRVSSVPGGRGGKPEPCVPKKNRSGTLRHGGNVLILHFKKKKDHHETNV